MSSLTKVYLLLQNAFFYLIYSPGFCLVLLFLVFPQINQYIYIYIYWHLVAVLHVTCLNLWSILALLWQILWLLSKNGNSARPNIRVDSFVGLATHPDVWWEIISLLYCITVMYRELTSSALFCIYLFTQTKWGHQTYGKMYSVFFKCLSYRDIRLLTCLNYFV